MRFFNLFTRKKTSKKSETTKTKADSPVISTKKTQPKQQQKSAAKKTEKQKTEKAQPLQQKKEAVPLADLPQLTNEQEPNVRKKKPHHSVAFDAKEEETLLHALEANQGNYLQMHLLYTQIAHFYYTYRTLDTKYLDLCISYCWQDIKSLDALKAQFIEQQIAQLKPTRKGAKKTKEERIKEIQDRGYDQEIACFKRLAIIYSSFAEDLMMFRV